MAIAGRIVPHSLRDRHDTCVLNVETGRILGVSGAAREEVLYFTAHTRSIDNYLILHFALISDAALRVSNSTTKSRVGEELCRS